MKILTLLFCLFASPALAQIIGPSSSGGGGGGGGTVTQGPQAVGASGNTWFVQQYLGGAAVSLTNPVPITPGTGTTFPVSGTVAATQSGTWNIGSVTTLPSITVGSSVLPTGAATSANQTSIQSSPGTPQTTAETIQGNASGVPVPVTVSGSSASQAITYAAPLTPVSVTTASTTILAAATYTHSLTLCTLPNATTGNVWLNLAGGAAVVGTGMFIPATGCVNIAPPTAAVTGISDSGTAVVTIQGG